MKRLIIVLFLIINLFSLTFTCFASETTDNQETVYFEDGSYIIRSVNTMYSRTAETVTGNATETYYSSDGTAKWKAVLSGTFTYTGTSSTCESSSVRVTIYDSNWYTISKSASKSGSAAIGLVTMGYKVFGVTTNQVSRDIRLTCDENGNLS